MTERTAVFVTKTYESATAYLSDLSPGSCLWCSYPERWIFRGQRDAGWKLIPSAFRPNAWRPYQGLEGGMETNNLRLQMELKAVRFFACEADRQGLHVPGFDESWLDEERLMQKFSYDIENVFCGKLSFPLIQWRPLFGMAQHYGIPTRLLDWSESAKIAAYFAAAKAADYFKRQSNDAGKYIAVWALDTKLLKSTAPDTAERIVTVRVRWVSNPNLRAQKGLFTLHEQSLVRDERHRVVPLEEIIEESHVNETSERDRPVLYCLRLSINKSPLLLRLLHQEGIHAGSIYPGYAGVTKSLREWQLHGVVNYRDFDTTEN